LGQRGHDHGDDRQMAHSREVQCIAMAGDLRDRPCAAFTISTKQAMAKAARNLSGFCLQVSVCTSPQEGDRGRADYHHLHRRDKQYCHDSDRQHGTAQACISTPRRRLSRKDGIASRYFRARGRDLCRISGTDAGSEGEIQQLPAVTQSTKLWQVITGACSGRTDAAPDQPLFDRRGLCDRGFQRSCAISATDCRHALLQPLDLLADPTIRATCSGHAGARHSDTLV